MGLGGMRGEASGRSPTWGPDLSIFSPALRLGMAVGLATVCPERSHPGVAARKSPLGHHGSVRSLMERTMGTDPEALGEAALALSEQHQAALASDLMVSLDGPVGDDIAEIAEALPPHQRDRGRAGTTAGRQRRSGPRTSPHGAKLSR